MIGCYIPTHSPKNRNENPKPWGWDQEIRVPGRYSPTMSPRKQIEWTMMEQGKNHPESIYPQEA